MQFLYSILSLPAYLLFLFYKGRRLLIYEDFNAWVLRHKLSSRSRHEAFVIFMCRFPEYRSILYHRMPFIARHFLNLFLKRRDIKISVGELMGGG